MCELQELFKDRWHLDLTQDQISYLVKHFGDGLRIKDLKIHSDDFDELVSRAGGPYAHTCIDQPNVTCPACSWAETIKNR
jgi:hypothetical protein